MAHHCLSTSLTKNMLLKQILMWCHHWLNLADRFMFINVWLTGQQTTPTRQMGSAPGRCGVNHCGVTESKLVSRKLIFVLVLTTPERRVYTIDLVMDSAFTFKTSWMNFYIEIGLAVCEYLEEETNIRSRVSNMHTHTHTLALHWEIIIKDLGSSTSALEIVSMSRLTVTEFCGDHTLGQKSSIPAMVCILLHSLSYRNLFSLQGVLTISLLATTLRSSRRFRSEEWNSSPLVC